MAEQKAALEAQQAAADARDAEAMAEQAQADVHEPMPSLDSLMTEVVDLGPTDAELIEQIADIYFWGDQGKALDRMQAIDFAAARGVVA